MKYLVIIETPKGKNKYKEKSLRALMKKVHKVKGWLHCLSYYQAHWNLNNQKDSKTLLVAFKKWKTIKIKPLD